MLEPSQHYAPEKNLNDNKQFNDNSTQMEQIFMATNASDHRDDPRKYDVKASSINSGYDNHRYTNQLGGCQPRNIVCTGIPPGYTRSENYKHNYADIKFGDISPESLEQGSDRQIKRHKTKLDRARSNERNRVHESPSDRNLKQRLNERGRNIKKRSESTGTRKKCVYLSTDGANDDELASSGRGKSNDLRDNARKWRSEQIRVSDQKIRLEGPAVLISRGDDFSPQAKSENEQASNFLSLTSSGNEKDRAAKERLLVEEKPPISKPTRLQNSSVGGKALLANEPSEIALVITAKSPLSIAGKKRAASGIYHVCLSVVANAKGSELEVETNNNFRGGREEFCSHIQCRGRDNMSENSGRTARLKVTGADVPKVNSKTEKIRNLASLKSSKRRESTSPDEGIVNSLDEMDEALSLSQKKVLPEVDNAGHIAITIEGGRTRESKAKRRSVRHEKGSHKRKTNDTNDASTSVSMGNGHILKSSHKEKKIAGNVVSATAITAKVTKEERAITRKVVRKALSDNSQAKSNKPVWVELPKNSHKTVMGNRTDKSKNNHIHSHRNGKVEGKHRTKHDDERTGKGAAKTAAGPHKVTNEHWKADNHKLSRRDAGKYRKKTTHHGKTDVSRVINSKKDRDGDANKAENRKVDIVRANNRDTSDVRKTTTLQRNRNRESNKSDAIGSNKTVSADSSVRDLSYSSSSSDTTSSSSSLCHSTSSSFASESISSSFSSKSSYNSTSSSTSEESHPSKDRKVDTRITKSKMNQGESTSKGRIDRTKYRVHGYSRASKWATTQGNDTKEHDMMDMKSIRKATREVEKSLAYDEEQEFEVNLERRRERNKKQYGAGDDKAAKDSQKNQWQHQRLVMTSRQTSHAVSDRRASEKSKQVVEPLSTPKERSFEASAKDSSGAILTIRDLYSLHQVLSDTQNGTVIAGHRRSDGMRVAIKRISKSATTRWGWMKGKVVPLELALLCQVNEVRHAGVVEIIEWHETTEAFLLVMVRPHPSVDLYDHVTKQKRLKESVARRIIKQLVMALAHCQNMGVLHRDVKLENILFNPDTTEAILIDFGCGDYCRSGSYKEFAGTPEYYPPEWFLYKQYSGDSATVWSIGVLMYSLLCGTLPFRSSKDIINKELAKFPVDISRQARHLIWEALKKNAGDRIELKSILNHPWFRTSREHSGIRKTSV